MVIGAAAMLVGIVLMSAGLLVYHLDRRSTERMIQDYVKAFPGRCIICAYHRFGVQEGLARGEVQPPRLH